MHHHPPGQRRLHGGFSLVELTIVVVILGVLSLLAVPRYQTAVERSKASEAFHWLAQVERAQQAYSARTGHYARKLDDLDVNLPSPEFFRVGRFTSVRWQDKWQILLTREGPSSGFGKYVVAWNQKGFVHRQSSIPAQLIPVQF